MISDSNSVTCCEMAVYRRRIYSSDGRRDCNCSATSGVCASSMMRESLRLDRYCQLLKHIDILKTQDFDGMAASLTDGFVIARLGSSQPRHVFIECSKGTYQ